MERIGFVGLGAMGSVIVPRLMGAGYTVCRPDCGGLPHRAPRFFGGVP